MSDLTPFYLHSRDARQAELDAQAGAEAWAQYGPPTEAMQVKPVNTSDVTQTDIGGNANVQMKPRLGAAPEPRMKLEGVPTDQPLEDQFQASGAALPGAHAPEPDYVNTIVRYIANTGDPEAYRKQLIEVFQKDPREWNAALQQFFMGLGLTNPPFGPAVNVAMRLAREGLEAAGVPEPYTTIGEYVAAALVPGPSFGGNIPARMAPSSGTRRAEARPARRAA